MIPSGTGSNDVGAFEETKCRRSIVSDTLQGLTEQAGRWREKIDLLEAGQRLDRDETVAELGRLLDACQNLRDAILSEDSGATWKTKPELQALVVRLDQVAEKRSRYLDLAQLLSAGTVSHRRERTKQERLRQRDAAVAELMEISAMITPPDLPGPAAEEWLNWACNLDDSSNDPDLAKLKTNFPRVDDFVRQLEIEMWQDGPISNPDHMVDTVPKYKPDSNGSSGASSTPTITEAPSSAENGTVHAEAETSTAVVEPETEPEPIAAETTQTEEVAAPAQP